MHFDANKLKNLQICHKIYKNEQSLGLLVITPKRNKSSYKASNKSVHDRGNRPNIQPNMYSSDRPPTSNNWTSHDEKHSTVYHVFNEN